MRTNTLRTAAGRAIATLGALLALAAAPAAANAAEAAAVADAAHVVADAAHVAADADRVFETRLDLGYRVVDASDDTSRLLLFDPLEDGPVLGLDLFYLSPGFGSLHLETGYLSPESWQAAVDYNRGADVAVSAATRAFTHADGHVAPVPTVFVPLPPPNSPIEIEGDDADPEAEYTDERRETTASLRVRIPGYPAHLRASGRVLRHEGDQQLRYFFRSCSTHVCHQNSRTRESDEETRSYTVGLDAHAGPVDLAYSHAAQTYRDEAPDPVDPIGDLAVGLPAGTYPHSVNPDQRSFSDTVTLNTNIANRVVFSAGYTGGEQENEASDVTRRTRTVGGQVSWRPAARAIVSGRYAYDAERTDDLGAEARALREARNAGHANFSHRHVVEPERTRHTGEVSGRFSPVPRADLTARVRYRALSRHTLLEKEAGAFVDEEDETDSTLAALNGRYRFGTAVSVDASLGHEWTSGPVYAIENTDVTRYGLGATWTPLQTLILRASWQGLRGENDEADALERAWAARPADATGLARDVTGDAFSATASFIPSPVFDLTFAWNLVDNGVEQDLLLGSPGTPGYAFLSRDTDWSGRSQLASARARWTAHRRLTLTAEGLWVDSVESYTPTVAQADGLEEASRVEFTKLLASLQADVRLTDAVGLTLTGFWAKFDDQVDDAGDGTARGLLAAVDYRW